MGLRKYTNFANDVKEFGPIGERRLQMILENKGHKFEDVSNDRRFNAFDIDVIQYDEDNITSDEIYKAYCDNKSARELNAVAYEVKTDTYGIISRNIVYEDLSNSNSGCMARTRADFLYYVFINENKEVVEEFLIEIKKLRWWLMTNFSAINKCDYLKAKSMRRGQDNTGIFLINIDRLIDDKVATKL